MTTPAVPPAQKLIRDALVGVELTTLDATVVAVQAEQGRINNQRILYQTYANEGGAFVDYWLNLERQEFDTLHPGDAPHHVQYLAGHPSLGGTDVTKWQIVKSDNATVVYAHADANNFILAGENQQNVFIQLMSVVPLFNLDARIGALQGVLDSWATYRALLVARDAIFNE